HDTRTLPLTTTTHLILSGSAVTQQTASCHFRGRSLIMIRFVGTTLACVLGLALSLPAQTTQKQTPPDNTKTNERDRSKANPVPAKQNENKSDLQLTQDIRRAITKDKS